MCGVGLYSVKEWNMVAMGIQYPVSSKKTWDLQPLALLTLCTGPIRIPPTYQSGHFYPSSTKASNGQPAQIGGLTCTWSLFSLLSKSIPVYCFFLSVVSFPQNSLLTTRVSLALFYPYMHRCHKQDESCCHLPNEALPSIYSLVCNWRWL